jgi:hypothetical protein
MAGKPETYIKLHIYLKFAFSYTMTVHPSKQASEIIEIINIGYSNQTRNRKEQIWLTAGATYLSDSNHSDIWLSFHSRVPLVCLNRRSLQKENHI